ncbi:monooxygenase [Fusarium mundagurra]|uniref:Monooxygenase n=1 Tax=Fusarium mundagurra TaxID=1567541 RepID=A0A8H6DEL3_9HYPO|nr:monooxygenase [Fusarium mundagurra]
MSKDRKPVLIIGAGVVGLVLAHGLKKLGIPFQIYERDSHISSRGQGWAITLHWVLPFLRELLSEEAFKDVESVQVDPEADRQGLGKFVFINLETLEPKFLIPPGDRRRVNREKLRKVLLKSVSDHVNWNKRLASIEERDDGVVARFEDGSRAEGSLIVGVEGSNSRTRKFLAPESYQNIRLPVRFTGAALDLTPEQVKPLKDIDPLLFQGCHPETGTFFWFSMLETPVVNGTAGTEDEHYRVQVMISWPMKTPEDEVKATDAERLAYMKQRATEFNPVLRDTVQRIPEGSEVIEIVLQDWPCPPWDNRQGRVTLAGDAAHAMTMYRGEAANHGILDAYRLTKALEGAYYKGKGLSEAVDEYEAELRERAKVAVLLSRQACLDAHDWAGLNENSAVLKKRAIAGV